MYLDLFTFVFIHLKLIRKLKKRSILKQTNQFVTLYKLTNRCISFKYYYYFGEFSGIFSYLFLILMASQLTLS